MSLQKAMGTRDLVFYGTGTILGAGIFVVVGEVLGEAGALAPIAYAAAGLVAVFTALSFAEMAARVPTAGGPIDYTEKAFGSAALSATTGWLLIIANIVSAATITTGFVSYLNSFIDVPGWIATAALIAALGAVSIMGIKQSAWFMTTTTAIGVLTLLIILWLMRDAVFAWPERLGQEAGIGDAGAVTAVFAGAFLALYSFIGFGDLAQVAEEVEDVKKSMPRAMVTVLVIVFVFYIAIAMALGGSDRIDAIANADAPLVFAATDDNGFPALPLAIASLCVIVNGALAQMIAASRMLMDMGRDNRSGMPDWLGEVNERTDTPIWATVISLVAVLVLALFIPLGTLASGTSLAILLVFITVNAALWKLKGRDQPEDVPNMWKLVPIIGTVLCVAAVVGQVTLWITGIGGSGGGH